MTGRDPTPATFRWWLRLQVGLMLGGAAVGVVGLVTEEDFVVGLAVGLLVGGLALRVGRRAAPAAPARSSREAGVAAGAGPATDPAGPEAAER